MRFMNLKYFALLLCLVMLLPLAACSGQGTQTPVDGTTVPEATEPGTTLAPDNPLEPDELPEVTVTVNGQSAAVTTTEGLAYTVTGYSSVNGASFTFTEGLTVDLGEEQLAAEFNRFSLTYEASAPAHVFVTYRHDGNELTDDFYIEQGQGVFSALIKGYLGGKSGSVLSGLCIVPCKGEAAELTLYRVKTETIPVYPGGDGTTTYYIENGRFKLGVDMGWGGTINYLQDLTYNRRGITNVVNNFDTGRLIQQSYYGTGAIEGVFEWGSFNGSDRWPYNPVQGGDKGNVASRLIDVQVGENYVYIKSQPMDWGKVDYITPSYMENKYILEADYVRVDNRFVDFSGWDHPYTGQELPALYTVSYLDKFVWYNGTEPWTGDDLSYRDDLEFWGDAKYAGDCLFKLKQSNTETWCAWVSDEAKFGIGLYVPAVDVLKAGRYRYDGSKKADAVSTNYVAPINSMQLVAYEALEYSYLLTTGTTDYIREVFAANKDFTDNAGLHEHYLSTRLPDLSLDMTNIDFSQQESALVFSDPHNASAEYDAEKQAVKLSVLGGDPYLSFEFDLSDKELLADDYGKIEIEYMIPTTNAYNAYGAQFFTCTGEQTSATEAMTVHSTVIADGEYHTLTLDVGKLAFWTGKIHRIRMDFFNACEVGDVMYVKSFRLVEGGGDKLPTIDPGGEPKLEFAAPEYIGFLTNNTNTIVSFSQEQTAAKLTVGNPVDVSVTLAFNTLGVEIPADQYKTLVIEYMIPESNGKQSYVTDLFLCAGSVTGPSGDAMVRVTGLVADGEYHSLEVDLSDCSFWQGTIHLIRLDYFDSCVEGDVFYLRSMALEE